MATDRGRHAATVAGWRGRRQLQAFSLCIDSMLMLRISCGCTRINTKRALSRMLHMPILFK